jgi:hypothetical protein
MERTIAERGAQARERASRGPAEKVFMGQVIDYARLMGWAVYHPWISVRSEPGFPDVLAVRAGRLVVAELKSLTGKLTPAQEQWLGALGAVPCCEVYIWYPTDEYWQEIERVLR